MKLRLATNLAIIGSILFVLGQLLIVLVDFDAFGTDNIDSIYSYLKWSSVFTLLGAISILNFFISFLSAQKKRG
ncbi:hypothetical protein [Cohnella soli]|uniref:Uncharacterized protein n=1 Tax=Cohnella soli TaxID=425005 RepID=A0ABW0HKL3_9BACL